MMMRAHRSIPPIALLAIIPPFLVLSALFPSGADAQRAGRSAGVSPELKQAIGELVVEAGRVLDTGVYPTDEADFASRTSLTLDPEEVAQALITRTHRGHFIDAYVRWQLTSYDPDLPVMEDERFLRLMESAPPLPENPRANGEIVALFERAAEAGPLNDSDRAKLQAMEEALEGRTRASEAAAGPARAWRKWIAEKLPDDGPRRLQWQLEELAATVAAGWPTRAIKTEITGAMTEAGDGDALSHRDRQMVAALMGDLAGRERRYIRELTPLANGRVEVSFSTARISADNVRKWTDRLFNVPGSP